MTLIERFERFDAANPNVYDLLKRFTFEAMLSGFPRYSVKAIFERIRWHLNVEIMPTDGEPFVLNNNYHAYYARKFMTQFPEHKGFFSTRRTKETA